MLKNKKKGLNYFVGTRAVPAATTMATAKEIQFYLKGLALGGR